MANSFTKEYDFYVGSNSASDIVVEGILVIDTAVGATAGTLLASLFGLNIVTRPCSFTISTDAASYIGAPSYDRASIIVKDHAGNAGVNLPNGTYKVSLQGR